MPKAHQVFIGCPFSPSYKNRYENLKKDLEKKLPLAFVLADTRPTRSNDYLLDSITKLITDSGSCIFDASGGNPNVSLEVGIAHATPVDFILTFNSRGQQKKPRKKQTSKAAEVRSIIADLQGKPRVEYKNYPSLKEQIVEKYLNHTPYLRKWNRFCHENKTLKKPALQVLHEIRGLNRITSRRVAAILNDTGIGQKHLMGKMRKHKLVKSKAGQAGGFVFPDS